MKKSMIVLLAIATIGLVAQNSHALGETGVTAYGTYWDGEEVGHGVGVKLSQSLLDILYLDGRAGYVNFDTVDSDMVPLEVTLNLGFPGLISPYVGIGAGYYYIDSPYLTDKVGCIGQIGIELSIVKVGVMAELRYHDLEGTELDDLSANIGILFRF